MIFVDANVPMYLVGSAHPHRSEAKRLGYPKLSARDAISRRDDAAHGVMRIMSFDAAFDGVPGLTRIA